MFFINKPVEVAKITSLFFGIFTIVLYYLTVTSAFPKEIAIASTYALSFYYIHIQLSTVAMANAGFIFFGTLSLYFFIRYLDNNTCHINHINLIASIIFTLIATTFRLEAWLLTIIYPGIIVLVNKQLKRACIFFIFSSLYIVNTLYIVYLHLGNPFAFLANPLFQWLCCTVFYKKLLSLSVISLTTLYFVATSTHHLSQTITTMQYSPSVQSLTIWLKRNCHSGDFLFSSFNELDIHAAALANKYIVTKPYRNELLFLSNLYDFLTGIDTTIDVGKHTSVSTALMQKTLYPLFVDQKLFLHLISERTEQSAIKRIVFLLNPSDYLYIKNHYPSLLGKVKIQFGGFAHYGFLSIDNITL